MQNTIFTRARRKNILHRSPCTKNFTRRRFTMKFYDLIRYSKRNERFRSGNDILHLFSYTLANGVWNIITEFRRTSGHILRRRDFIAIKAINITGVYFRTTLINRVYFRHTRAKKSLVTIVRRVFVRNSRFVLAGSNTLSL